MDDGDRHFSEPRKTTRTEGDVTQHVRATTAGGAQTEYTHLTKCYEGPERQSLPSPRVAPK